MLNEMPSLIVMRKSSLKMFKTFKDMLVDLTINKHVTPNLLGEDLHVQTFLALVDCPETALEVELLWNKHIE